MNTEELKRIISTTSGSFDFYVKGSVLKRLLRKNVSLILNASKKSEEMLRSESKKWLNDNAMYIYNTSSHISFHNVCISEGLIDFLGKMISSDQFSWEEDTVESIYAFLSDHKLLTEAEIFGVHPALLFVTIQNIAQCCKLDSTDLAKFISLLHKFSDVPFHTLETLYSPLERILRYDPDGTYPRMTRGTQEYYRKQIRFLAKKEQCKQDVFCKKLLEKAKREENHIGFYLFKTKKNSLYIPLLFSVYLVFLLSFVCSVRSFCLTAFIMLPLYFFVKKAFDYVFCLCSKTIPLPSLKVERIGEKEKTCVVISVLITNEEDIKNFAKRLHSYQLNNYSQDEKVFFGLLCDLKESEKEEMPEDAKLIDCLRQEICSLNNENPVFFSVIRKRIYHKSEGLYVGRERKRGAIEDFVSVLSGKEPENVIFMGDKNSLVGTKYLLTLDADTYLSIGQVRKLVGTALHPLNRPVIEERKGKRRVVRGYGILQPKITSSLLEKTKTPFGKILSNGSGIPIYATASYDTLQNNFGEGNFCGKGLIDVACYETLLSDRFPEQRILSHDMLEGAILRAGIVSNEYFADSNPQVMTSFYKRQHRWIRGDIQNLPFYGELTSVRKFFAYENLMSYFVPLSEFLLLFVSCFFGVRIASICALLCVLFHLELFIITGTNLILSGNVEHLYRRFATKMRNLLLNSFYQCILSLSSIAFEAYYYSDAILRACYRMIISKKKLLEWQVYSPFSASKGSLWFYTPSILIAFASLLVLNNSPFLLIASLWLVFPFLGIGVSKNYVKKRGWTEKEKAELLKMAKEEFSFFEKFVSEKTKHLPPDNIQFEPREKIAMRTSPTNIGLYFASLAAARELDLISTNSLCKKICSAITSMKLLERWNSHLYNWYDLNSLQVIGDRFVSTVDSGNYVASLIFTVQNLKKRMGEDARIKEILTFFENEINTMNFQYLMDSSHYLLKVGIWPENYNTKVSCYDHYMSEARITAFVAIATGSISPQLWLNLSRPLLSFRGRAGIGSWSGTAFEYFMAPLFLPVIDNSMEDETLSFALYCQEKFSANFSSDTRVFGISESGFSVVDHNDNYQYKAFGVPYLSVQSGNHYPKIISPYSSFLMLERLDRTILKNLKNFEKFGMKGGQGFYEACEFHSNFVGDYSVIRSYMAHHKGMSFLALANAVRDGIVQRDFLSYKNFSSKIELLAERFPIEGKIIRKNVNRPGDNETTVTNKPVEFAVSDQNKTVNLISDGKFTMIFFSNGDNRFIFRGREVFDYKNGGIRFSVQLGEDVLDCESQNVKKTVRFEPMLTEFRFVYRKVAVLIRFQLLSGKDAFLIRSEIQGFDGKCSITFDFTAVMQDESVYRAHPAFHALSLEGSAEENSFTICKRENDFHRYLHIQSDRKIQTELYGGGYEKNFEKRPLIDGKVKIIQNFEHGSGETGYLIVNACDSALKTDHSNLLDGGYYPVKTVTEKALMQAKRLYRDCHYDSDCLELEKTVLVSYHSPSFFEVEDNLVPRKKDVLWKYGISGDEPILSYVVDENDPKSFDLVGQFLRVTKKLLLSGIRLDLIIIQKGQSGYFNHIRDKFTDLVTKYKCEFLIGTPAGIHFVCVEDPSEYDFLRKLSFFPRFENSLEVKGEIKPVTNSFSSAEDAAVVEATKNEIVIDKNQFNPPVPFSHVVSNRVCGFVCDQNSLGFTWYRNSGLMRMSKWNNIPTPSSGEKIYLHFNGEIFDLITFADRVVYRRHFAIYEGKIFQHDYKIIATVSEITSGKIIFVSLSEPLKSSVLSYSFVPVVGAAPNCKVSFCRREGLILFSPMIAGEIRGMGYFAVRGKQVEMHQSNDRVNFDFPSDEENLIFFGGGNGKKHFDFLKSVVENESVEKILQKEKEVFEPYHTHIVNKKEMWIHYQSLHSRFFGRTGLYQSSGAWGFRDQLQDSLIFLKTNPEQTRIHLIRCAAHQFEEGDVQHWWHTIRGDGKCDPGIRSRCSDDYLWLLFVASRYLSETGDLDLLDVSVPYLSAENLKGENERYFIPKKGKKASFQEHLEKAAKLLLNRPLGKNGLPDAGSGDWNDGMNQIEGESVWLGFFGAICLKSCYKYFSTVLKKEIDQYLTNLSVSLSRSFNGSWFVRAFRENGDVLGNDISLERECSIDLITQAFAAFYQLEFSRTQYALDDKMIYSALDSAFEILSDEKNRTTALFTGPFSETNPSPGYIQRYAAGVRENGGQYTHAAVWFALALIRFGRKNNDKSLIQKGMQIQERLDPFVNVDQTHFKRYRREPYVLCGDVYTAQGNRGHGGWSWYTGAAGWYMTLLDEIKAIKRENESLIPKTNEQNA